MRCRHWVILFTLLFACFAALTGCGGATGLPGGNHDLAAAGAAGAEESAGAPNEVTAGAPSEAGAGGENAGGAGGAQAEAVLVSLAVTPAVGSVAVGTSLRLRATGVYSDGTAQDLTGQVVWNSSNAMIAGVAGGVVTGTSPGSATITATLEGFSASATVTVPAATIVSIVITPGSATTAARGTVTFRAVITLSDGTTQDVTETAVWSSSPATVASVSNVGVATGVAPGVATIGASVAKVSASAKLTVTSATLVSIQVTPTNPTIGIGVSQHFTATGTFSDGSVADVSGSATFASSKPAVASLDASHTAKASSAGSTTITASIGAVSGTTTLTVTAATLTAIEVQPATSTIALKGTVALTATGTYSDGTRADVTSSAIWTSSSAAVAAVSNAVGTQGRVTGLSAGSATVTATLGAISGSAAVTVTAAKLVSIAVSPQNPSLPLGASTALKATGTYSDGSSIDITALVTWSSDAPDVASVDNAAGKQGSVSAVKVGKAVVSAKLTGIAGSTTVTVTPAQLVSIALTPANPTVAAGNGVALKATAKYSDGSTLDVTQTAVWSSSATAVATVSNAAGSQGQVTAVTEGTATVSAKVAGVTGTTVVTVSAPTITQIVLSPIADSVRVGDTVRYTATAIYSNNTQRPLAQGVTWSSSNTAVATIRAGGGMGMGMGVGGATATAVGEGTTTISATYQGLSGSTTLTVTSATIVSIEVTPTDPTLTVGQTQQLTATAIYSDNTSANITAQATWVSSDQNVAQVTTAGMGGPGGGGAGGRGRVTGVAAGTATIKAALNGLSGSTTVTVSSATLVSIQIDPAGTSVPVGTRFAFTATGIYSDNTSRNLTGQATWVSSDPSVASVSTAGPTRGQAVALASGSTTIQATVAGVTGTTALQVTDAKLTQVQVTPFNPTLPIGFTANLVAIGVYSDNSTRDLTAQVTWSSESPAVASVSNANGSRGQLSPLAAGQTTVTATYQGVSGTDVITVTSATLTSVQVTPGSAAIAVRATQPFVATGTLSDKTTLDVSAYVTWLSTTPAIASISNAPGSRGIATGLSAGSVTISAVRGAVTGTAKLTVK